MEGYYLHEKSMKGMEEMSFQSMYSYPMIDRLLLDVPKR